MIIVIASLSAESPLSLFHQVLARDDEYVKGLTGVRGPCRPTIHKSPPRWTESFVHDLRVARGQTHTNANNNTLLLKVPLWGFLNGSVLFKSTLDAMSGEAIDPWLLSRWSSLPLVGVCRRFCLVGGATVEGWRGLLIRIMSLSLMISKRRV